MDVARLAKAYVKMRDARAELSKKFKEEDDKIKVQMEKIDAAMLGILQAQNVESIRTEAGTFYREVDIKPRADDWQEVYKWIRDNNAWEMMEKRLTKTFIKSYMDANDGALPAGVSVLREYVVRVRRPNT